MTPRRLPTPAPALRFLAPPGAGEERPKGAEGASRRFTAQRVDARIRFTR